MRDDLQCPYCGNWLEADSDVYEAEVHHEMECKHCLKHFGYTISYNPDYYTYELPCANGEPHNYKPICGLPEEYFIGKVRCSYCGDETTKEKVNEPSK